MSNLREATAYRLFDYGCGSQPYPMPTSLPSLSAFEEMMYKVAYRAGYVGTKVDFMEDFSDALNGAQKLAGLIIQKSSVNDFPDIGRENAIYIDTSKKEVYFWKEDGYYKVGVENNSDNDDNQNKPGEDDNEKPGDDNNPTPPPSEDDEIIYEGGEL